MGKEQVREPISKRLRFDVFKRDAFTCQYCGKKAPDVILEVDHVEPISKGGKTDMFNLVTSCKDCNRGKSNIKLSDTSVIERQRRSLLELNEKQEQLKMLLKWRSGLLKIEEQELQAIIDNWDKLTGYSFTEHGLSSIKKLLKEYGLLSVLDAMDISVNRYLEFNKGKATESSIEVTFNKMKGICYVKSLPEEKREEYKVIGQLKYFMRKKFYNCNEKWMAIYINKFIRAGYTTDELESTINNSDSFNDWENKISEYFK